MAEGFSSTQELNEHTSERASSKLKGESHQQMLGLYITTKWKGKKMDSENFFDCIKKIKPIKYLLNPILITVMQYEKNPVCLILYIMFISRQISEI